MNRHNKGWYFFVGSPLHRQNINDPKFQDPMEKIILLMLSFDDDEEGVD